MKAKHSNRFELVIPSELDRIQEVEDFTDKILAKLNLSNEERDSLAIAVTETANNAIIHGNKKDPTKFVTIGYLIEDKKLFIQIKDQGQGFNPDEIDDPRSPENLLKERGRGIFIVKTLMNEVNFEYDGDGMLITLVKYLK
jgi:serine/threonine-protein kinase RsbW